MHPAQRQERNASQVTPVVGKCSHATKNAIAFEDEAGTAAIRHRAAIGILPNCPSHAVRRVELDRRRNRRLTRYTHRQGLRLAFALLRDVPMARAEAQDALRPGGGGSSAIRSRTKTGPRQKGRRFRAREAGLARLSFLCCHPATTGLPGRSSADIRLAQHRRRAADWVDRRSFSLSLQRLAGRGSNLQYDCMTVIADHRRVLPVPAPGM